MGTFQSFRKAYGALKDSTKVGLAKVNSEYKDLDIAIVKATNHVECPPKERHVRKIFSATSVMRPRADVAYCIHALAKRLSKTRSWIVALKTLIVVHRTLREGDPTFREELLSYSHRGHILQISNFKDESSPLAWDCSAWVRTYALYLEERLECYRILKYDIESERLTKTSPGAAKVHSRTRLLNCDELLEQLPALQQLLYRLKGCQPEGGAYSNYLIQYALALVLKESFKIYCAINDGIINLVDMFFDMPRHDAVKALNIYKRASNQAENLSEFYEYCKGLELARTFQFPTLKQPPPSFLSTMEEYIREAPQTGSVHKRLEYQEVKQLTQEPESPEEPAEIEKEVENVEDNEPVVEDTEEEESQQNEEEEVAESPPLIATDDKSDLLGLSEINPKAAEIEKNNALALAITTDGNNPPSSNRSLSDIDSSGWELELVSTPSNDAGPTVDSRLAGGFDKLLLDSLYEDEHARSHLQLQNAGYGPYGETSVQNPFEHFDPFSLSSSIAPPPCVQMAMMAQQQQMLFQQQQQESLQTDAFPQQQQQQQQEQQLDSNDSGTMVPYEQQEMQQFGPFNPFGDPFLSFPQTSTPRGENHNLI
ncbi:putative clathrin assembly protein At5g57200 [Cucurbita pepo subsp. pepo]|uniref:putative clathrin assembly protein At5g57200 n=1 Tax=Cucurbita pepo subsp. pepo TaxID=3664 RepID=UPI000C9D987E|nr:putative clathrin assembly protein At5g57200 [Cucurbita pepo subsp. pepo]